MKDNLLWRKGNNLLVLLLALLTSRTIRDVNVGIEDLWTIWILILFQNNKEPDVWLNSMLIWFDIFLSRYNIDSVKHILFKTEGGGAGSGSHWIIWLVQRCSNMICWLSHSLSWWLKFLLIPSNYPGPKSVTCSVYENPVKELHGKTHKLGIFLLAHRTRGDTSLRCKI